MMGMTGRFLIGVSLRALLSLGDCGFSTGTSADMRLYCSMQPGIASESSLFGVLKFSIVSGNGLILYYIYPGSDEYSDFQYGLVILMERRLLHMFSSNPITRWLG